MSDFVGVLMDMAGGRAAQEVSREFSKLMAAVVENNGKGELTVKIKVEPEGWDEEGGVRQVNVTHSVATKEPRRRLGRSTFFVDENGGLSRHEPNQLLLDVEEAGRRR